VRLLLATMPTVHLLDYVAGNVRSLVNAIEKVGYDVKWIRSPEEISQAEVSLRQAFNFTIGSLTLTFSHPNRN
jgi:hypothetical protein